MPGITQDIAIVPQTTQLPAPFFGVEGEQALFCSSKSSSLFQIAALSRVLSERTYFTLANVSRSQVLPATSWTSLEVDLGFPGPFAG